MLKRLLLFFGFFGCAVLVYRNGFHIPFYYDDFQRVFTNPHAALFSGFFQANPYDHFYRPIEQMILAAIQILYGWDTLPIRLLHLFLHTGIAILVYHVLRSRKIHVIPAIAGGVFVIVSQLSGYVILSNNTLSQLLATFFSALSLWCIYCTLIAEEKQKRLIKYIASVICFFLAILSKETAFFLLFAIPLLIIILQWKPHNQLQLLSKIFLPVLPFAIVFLFYWILRMHAGSVSTATQGSRYSFFFGGNIFRNIFLFAGQSLQAFSSVTVMRSFNTHAYPVIIFIGVYTGFFAFLILYAFRSSLHRTEFLILSALILLSWFPALLLTSLTESYVYNSLPYVGVLVGITVEVYWRNPLKMRGGIRICVSLFLFSIGIINVSSTNKKVALMKHEGDRAKALLPEIIFYAKTVPAEGWIYLVDRSYGFTYSRFLSSSFSVTDYADSLVRFFAHRPDIRILKGDSISCSKIVKDRPGLMLAVDMSTLKIYKMH